MQYPHLVRHAEPVLPPMLERMRALPELQGNKASFNDTNHAAMMAGYSHKRALMAMLIEMAYIGRRFGHVLQLKMGHVTFEHCPFPQLPDSRAPPSFYIAAHVRFVTNKSDGGFFQSVHLNSQRYTGNETDQELATMYAQDPVLRLHHFMFMQNAFIHSQWSDALRCPAMQPACLELPLFRHLDIVTGVPTYEAVGKHTARQHFCCCAYAAGYRGITPHGACLCNNDLIRKGPHKSCLW